VLPVISGRYTKLAESNVSFERLPARAGYQQLSTSDGVRGRRGGMNAGGRLLIRPGSAGSRCLPSSAGRLHVIGGAVERRNDR
jgi:hypothetical protein